MLQAVVGASRSKFYKLSDLYGMPLPHGGIFSAPQSGLSMAGAKQRQKGPCLEITTFNKSVIAPAACPIYLYGICVSFAPGAFPGIEFRWAYAVACKVSLMDACKRFFNRCDKWFTIDFNQ